MTASPVAECQAGCGMLALGRRAGQLLGRLVAPQQSLQRDITVSKLPHHELTIGITHNSGIK